jgi:hypothetical protein
VPVDDRLPRLGTILTRRYKGRTLQVEVLEHGFAFEGKTYRSLSAVAKAVSRLPKTHIRATAWLTDSKQIYLLGKIWTHRQPHWPLRLGWADANVLRSVLGVHCGTWCLDSNPSHEWDAYGSVTSCAQGVVSFPVFFHRLVVLCGLAVLASSAETDATPRHLICSRRLQKWGRPAW